MIEKMVRDNKGTDLDMQERSRLAHIMMNMNTKQMDVFKEIGQDTRAVKIMQDMQNGIQPDFSDPDVQEAMMKLQKLKDNLAGSPDS